MAGPNKRRAIGGGQMETDEHFQQTSDSESGQSADEDDAVNQVVQVDFEARIPVDGDFHGIKRLLQQLFLKANIDLTELTNLILKQNYIGSVIKQSEIPEDEDSDDDDRDGDVFGIISALNITDKKNVVCVEQLRTMLLSKCGQSAIKDKLATILGDETKPVGFIICERFINIPSQIALPMYENLSKEIEDAIKKSMKFHFEYYIIISKVYKVQGDELVSFANAEEELFQDEAELQFEYCVQQESDSALGGNWDADEEAAMQPYRRVYVVRAKSIDTIMVKMRMLLSQT